MPNIEYVDILEPPMFTKSGKTKPLTQAWEDGDWIGTFNLWIISLENPDDPALIYQQRSLRSSWEPGKLDVTAGGHYTAGETLEQGLREVREELGKNFAFADLTYLGRRLNVSRDTRGRLRNTVVDICVVRDSSPLADYQLEESEVTAIFRCSLRDLSRLHTTPGTSFAAEGIDSSGRITRIAVTQDSFPINWDNYHQKMIEVANRLSKGETDVHY